LAPLIGPPLYLPGPSAHKARPKGCATADRATLAPKLEERSDNDRGAQPKSRSAPPGGKVAQFAAKPGRQDSVQDRHFRARVPILTLPTAASAPAHGLPARLKAGAEALSGLAMDDVRVHRNSPEPARLGALAYTRGSDIHLGPGQEEHLPHEAWHVVQQKQGRVKATAQMKAARINDDQRLEAEADAYGARSVGYSGPSNVQLRAGVSAGAAETSIQRQVKKSKTPPSELGQMVRAIVARKPEDAVMALAELRNNLLFPGEFTTVLAMALPFILPQLGRYGMDKCYQDDRDTIASFDSAFEKWFEVKYRLDPSKRPVRLLPAATGMRPRDPNAKYRTMSLEQEYHHRMDTMFAAGPMVFVAAGAGLFGKDSEKVMEWTAPVGGVLAAIAGAGQHRIAQPNLSAARQVDNSAYRATTNPWKSSPPPTANVPARPATQPSAALATTNPVKAPVPTIVPVQPQPAPQSVAPAGTTNAKPPAPTVIYVPPQSASESLPPVETTRRRNKYPDFQPLLPSEKARAALHVAEINKQLGINIPLDRVLAAPWIGSAGSATSEGYLRSPHRFWARFEAEFGPDFKMIGPGRRVTADLAKAWSLGDTIGQKLIHHHIKNSYLVIPLPADLHSKKDPDPKKPGLHATVRIGVKINE